MRNRSIIALLIFLFASAANATTTPLDWIVGGNRNTNGAAFGTLDNTFVPFFTNGSERMRIFASGGVSVGDTTDPGATNFRVAGDETVVGNVTATGNSHNFGAGSSNARFALRGGSGGGGATSFVMNLGGFDVAQIFDDSTGLYIDFNGSGTTYNIRSGLNGPTKWSMTSAGATTAFGASHIFGTAGTSVAMTVGQGTTGSDTAKITIRSGNTGTTAPSLLLNRNATDLAQFTTNGTDTFEDYTGTLTFRSGIAGTTTATIDSAGSFTAAGSTFTFGTAGTATTMTVGQGTTGTDASTLTIRSGNSGTTAPSLTLNRNGTDAAQITYNGTSTFIDYTGILGFRSGIAGTGRWQLTAAGSMSAFGPNHALGTGGTATTLTVGQGTTGTDASTLTIRSGNSGTTAPAILLRRNTTDLVQLTTDGTDTFEDYTGTKTWRTGIAGSTRMTLTSGGIWTLTTSDSATNTITDGVVLRHNTSGTAAAGFGHGIDFNLDSTTTANRDAAEIAAIWTTATDASRSSAITFKTVSNQFTSVATGTLAETSRFSDTGLLTIGETAITTQTAALTYTAVTVFPAGITFSAANGSYQGLGLSSTITFTTASGAFGESLLFQFAPTITISGSNITNAETVVLNNNATWNAPDGFKFGKNDVIGTPAITGYWHHPVLSVTGTGQLVLGTTISGIGTSSAVYSSGTIGAGVNAPGWNPIYITSPANSGTIGNFFGVFLDAMNLNAGTGAIRAAHQFGGVGATILKVAAPSTAPTTAATSGGKVSPGSHSWKYTCVDSNGLETTPSNPSTPSLTIADGTQTVTVTVPACTSASSRRVYRTKSGDTGSYFYVGRIANNTNNATLSDTSSDELLANLTASATAPTVAASNGGSVTAGLHSWKYTCVSDTGGETSASTASAQLNIANPNQTVTVTLPACGVANRRYVYRTVAGDTGAYKYVGSVANNTNGATFSDNIADGSLVSVSAIETVTAPSTMDTVPSGDGFFGLESHSPVRFYFKNDSQQVWRMGYTTYTGTAQGASALAADNTTRFFYINSLTTAPTTTESTWQIPTSGAITVFGISCSVATAPDNGAGTQTRTFTVRVAGADSSPVLQCSISEANKTCNSFLAGNTTAGTAITGGALIDLSSAASGTPAATAATCTTYWTNDAF